MGRPSSYSAEIAAEICERLSSGVPLSEVCRADAMPHPSTFRRWCDDGGHELEGVSLAIAYARAREDGFDAIASDALDIADDVSGDTKTVGEDQREVADTEWISRSKLRVETRLKLLAKWDPKRYGDKTLIGSDPDNPLPASVSVLFRKADAASD